MYFNNLNPIKSIIYGTNIKITLFSFGRLRPLSAGFRHFCTAGQLKLRLAGYFWALHKYQGVHPL